MSWLMSEIKVNVSDKGQMETRFFFWSKRFTASTQLPQICFISGINLTLWHLPVTIDPRDIREGDAIIFHPVPSK